MPRAVEFDLAYVPEEVSELYRSTDQQLLRECRVLMLAMVAAWRWDRNDQFPNGHKQRENSSASSGRHCRAHPSRRTCRAGLTPESLVDDKNWSYFVELFAPLSNDVHLFRQLALGLRHVEVRWFQGYDRVSTGLARRP